MTPSDIEVLIHCHASGGPHPRADAPAVREAIRMFLEAELIEQLTADPTTYTTTDGGKLLIEELCRTPFPIKKWTMP